MAHWEGVSRSVCFSRRTRFFLWDKGLARFAENVICSYIIQWQVWV